MLSRMHTHIRRTFHATDISAVSTSLMRAPLFDGDDDGGAGGGDGTAEGAAAAAAAAAATPPYRLTDDSMVDLGDGKPVKWGQHRSNFIPRDQYERGVGFLSQMAKVLDSRVGQQPAAKPQAQQPAAAAAANADPFADVENMSVIDGRTLAKLARKLTQEGFGPMGTAMTQIATRLQALEGQVKGVNQISGSLAEHHQTQEFETFLSSTIKALPEIKGLGTLADAPEVRELLKDIYLSHDQKDPSLAREFAGIAQSRIEGMFKLFTKMQKAAVEGAKEKKRQFFNPNKGAAVGSGAPAYKHLSADEIASHFFGGGANT